MLIFCRNYFHGTSTVTMRSFCPGIALLVFCALALSDPRSLEAQQPSPSGSAAGYGLAAMTEARLSEAALWNPALAGIFDGPMSSFSLLQVGIEPGDWGRLRPFVNIGRRLVDDPVGVIDHEMGSLFEALRSDDALARLRAGGVVQWVGLHSRDVLISLSSQASLDYRIPGVALDIVTSPEATTELPDYDPQLLDQVSTRMLATTLAVAKGTDLGRLPQLGRTWVGLTAKATLVHEHALGGFQFVDAAILVSDSEGRPLDPNTRVMENEIGVQYSEVALRNARIYAVDVGFVSNPWPPVLVSVAIANLLQVATLSPDPDDFYSRAIGFAGRDSLGLGRAFTNRETLDLTAEHRPWFVDGEYLARATHFTPVIRGGLSVDTRQGRFILGAAIPLEREYSLDRRSLDEYTVAWQSLSSATRPRIAYTRRLDGTSGIMYGAQRGYCADRLAWSVGWFRRPGGEHSFNVTLGWSRGRAPCGHFR